MLFKVSTCDQDVRFYFANARLRERMRGPDGRRYVEQWFEIEVSSLEELIGHMKRIKEPIIISETMEMDRGEDGEPKLEIEVYDGYRE